jgi:hypothetical protein
MQDTDNDTYVDVETAADNDEINFAAFDGTSTLTGIKIHAPATGDLQLDLGPDDVGSRTNPPLKIGDDAGLYAPANAFDVFEFVGAGGTVVAQVRADDGGLCGGQKEACLSMTGVSPGIYDWGDQNTGVDWVGADQVGFVAGSQRLFNVHRTVDDHQMTFLSDNAGNLAWDLFVIDGDADTLENEGGTDFWITKDADAHMTSFTTYAESFVDA